MGNRRYWGILVAVNFAIGVDKQADFKSVVTPDRLGIDPTMKSKSA
jgi:hypothetical protein